jgi:hypothetical protein
MYKTLAAAGIAAALLFAVPQGASALPGQGTDVKASSDVVQAGYKHRHYKHRHWKRGHHHHNRNRYYRKRKGLHIHVH